MQTELGKILDLNIPDAEKSLILSGNWKRITGS